MFIVVSFFFCRPLNPGTYNWRLHYADFFRNTKIDADETAVIRFADVGCGFGGLLVKLSPLFPSELSLGKFSHSYPTVCAVFPVFPVSLSFLLWTLARGMEIRDKVSQYVKERCLALRRSHRGLFENISCVRTNSMKHMPHFFRKGQLSKLFFLFPDPHFKTANHRRRIIQHSLLAEYAFTLAVGGLLYLVTDVEELGQWMSDKLGEQKCFERLSVADMETDLVVPILFTGSEEGQKVERNEGKRFLQVFRRIAGPK